MSCFFAICKMLQIRWVQQGKITRDFESLRGVKNADPSPNIHRCFNVRSLSLDKGLKANGIHQEKKYKVQKILVNIVLIL